MILLLIERPCRARLTTPSFLWETHRQTVGPLLKCWIIRSGFTAWKTKTISNMGHFIFHSSSALHPIFWIYCTYMFRLVMRMYAYMANNVYINRFFRTCLNSSSKIIFLKRPSSISNIPWVIFVVHLQFLQFIFRIIYVALKSIYIYIYH